ncbi:pyruvate kinase [Fundidesulfovibrio soli]|uniref:pyruvate kinase n=1 Tax=Fundidesulfovibrio soli TaxID=2922716 RepID=UPI001FAF6C96|nr:pyruvate kinase [Fundidesulfovibrio soli]
MTTTKIIATLGPASMSKQSIKELALAGATIFRLNFSHSVAADFLPVIKAIREVESELGLPLTALGDLCGPKTRIGEIENAPRQVNKGQTLLLGLPDETPGGDKLFIPLDVPALLEGLQPGMPVNLSDGMLQFTVTRTVKQDRLYEIQAHNAGMLASRKGIAFPGKHHALPALTAKDIVDLHEGIDAGLNAVALSFVQNGDDIRHIKDEIARHGVWIPVVAKLERQNAVDRLDEILALTDIVMVARGDLGLECPISQLPIIQKRIIRACRHAQKPAIVATQMLLSMVKNPIPTRAESTDVANAIMDGADCVMLSEETAVGDYPVKAVEFMREISDNAVQYYLERIQGPYAPKKEKNPSKYLAYSACILADNAESKALVSHSTSGVTARLLSSRRPALPIYALTPDEKIIHNLNFVWGVVPRLIEASAESHSRRAERFVAESPDFAPGESVVITSGQPTPGQTERFTNQIKLYYK